MKVTLQTRARKIPAHVDWGPSGGSSVRRPGGEDPHWPELKFTELSHNLVLGFFIDDFMQPYTPSSQPTSCTMSLHHTKSKLDKVAVTVEISW